MLVIRLQRTGRENIPAFRVVVAEKRNPVKGKFLEIVGHYLPARATPVLEIQKERIGHWVKRGARPSDTVARLLKKSGVPDMDAFIVRYTKKRRKGEEKKESSDTPAKAA